MAAGWNRVGVCRYRSFFALALPRSRSRSEVRLPKSAGYSAGEVEQFLQDEEDNGFKSQPLPEGCNFVIVSMPKAVMRAYRQRHLVWIKSLQAQR